MSSASRRPPFAVGQMRDDSGSSRHLVGIAVSHEMRSSVYSLLTGHADPRSRAQASRPLDWRVPIGGQVARQHRSSLGCLR
jgi:hypothetical protein